MYLKLTEESKPRRKKSIIRGREAELTRACNLNSRVWRNLGAGKMPGNIRMWKRRKEGRKGREKKGKEGKGRGGKGRRKEGRAGALCYSNSHWPSECPFPSPHPLHSVPFVIISILWHYWSSHFAFLPTLCPNLELSLAFGFANLALPDLFHDCWLQTIWPGHCLSSSFRSAFAFGTCGYPIQHSVSFMRLAHIRLEDNANTQMCMWISAKHLFV